MMYPKKAGQIRLQANHRLQQLHEQLGEVEWMQRVFDERNAELYPRAKYIAKLMITDMSKRNRVRLELYNDLMPPGYTLQVDGPGLGSFSVGAPFLKYIGCVRITERFESGKGCEFAAHMYMELPVRPSSTSIDEKIEALRMMLEVLPPAGEVLLDEREMKLLGEA